MHPTAPDWHIQVVLIAVKALVSISDFLWSLDSNPGRQFKAKMTHLILQSHQYELEQKNNLLVDGVSVLALNFLHFFFIFWQLHCFIRKCFDFFPIALFFILWRVCIVCMTDRRINKPFALLAKCMNASDMKFFKSWPLLRQTTFIFKWKCNVKAAYWADPIAFTKVLENCFFTNKGSHVFITL